MNQEDLDLEQRVWQRVDGGRCPQPEGDYRAMLLRAEESAAIFRLLANHSAGTRKEQLWALHKRCAAHADCLRGMMLLKGSAVQKERTYTPPKESTQRMLAQAYRRSVQQHQDYVNSSDDEAYGITFAALARQEEQTGLTVLELIGK